LFSQEEIDDMKIQAETPDQPEVRALLARLDAYCAALYPAESNHLMDIRSLTGPDVVFLVARDDAGRAAGCGALVSRDSYGEIKRMFVDPACRGRGIAAALMDELSARAAALGIRQLNLETGIHQPEAIALYRRAGFARCAPFGDYLSDPLSVFMGKAL
jgi:putative acetyltransferase